MSSQPITAAPEVVPRDGLAGAVGYGVIIPEGGDLSGSIDQPGAPEDPMVAGIPAPLGDLPSFQGPGPTGDALDASGRWSGPAGYHLEGLGCGPSAYTAQGDFCGAARTWGPGRAVVTVGGDQRPFVVGASVKCSTLGSPTSLLAEYGPKADRALELSRWPQIANELWTGQRSIAEGWTNHRLASPTATILSESPVPLVEAIAALEDAFGDCSASDVQVIHVPRKLSAYLSHAQIVQTTPGSGRIFTANNSLIVADRGYPGTAPDGAPPEGLVCWIYATGVMTARLGRVVHPQRDLGDAVSFQRNDVNVRAEQLAAIDWLCCHLAIPVAYSIV